MTINLTNLTSADNMKDVVDFANQSSNNILLIGIIIVIFFIMILKLKDSVGIDRAFLAGSWIAFLLSSIAWAAQLFSPKEVYYPLAFLLMTALSGLYVKYNHRE